jgi:hypothetical protein
MLSDWNAVVEKQKQQQQLATVTAKTEFLLRQHEAEEIRECQQRSHLTGFVDYVFLDMQTAGPVTGMGAHLTQAEVQMYAMSVQQLAEQQQAQAAAAMLLLQQQQQQAVPEVHDAWLADDDASSMAAAAAAAAAAGGGSEAPAAGTDAELQQQQQQGPQGRRSRSNVSAASLLGKRERAPYRSQQCAQCGLVKKDNRQLGEHEGKSGWKAGRFCRYPCSKCGQAMENHTKLCKHDASN